MKNSIKRAASLLLALVLVFSLAGCYSEDMTWAAKCGDKTMPIGGYIYYLSTAYTEAAAKVDSAEKVMDSQIEEKDAEEWIRDRAAHYIRQYFWMDEEMERLGIEMTDADYENASATTNSYWTIYGGDEMFQEYGIARSSFDIAFSQYNIKFQKIFEAIYGEGGEKEVPESDLIAQFTDNYYSYEYFTAPMALPDASGNPVAMTEDEKEAFREHMEDVKSEILSGDKTVADAAADYAAAYNQEKTSYVKEVNNPSGLAGSSLPTAFLESLAGLQENELTVLEVSNYMVILRRLPIKDSVNEMLEDASSRLTVLSEVKSEEYREYAESCAEEFEGIEFNTKAMEHYKPKMFVNDDTEYGTLSSVEISTADDETVNEDSAETSSEESAEE